MKPRAIPILEIQKVLRRRLPLTHLLRRPSVSIAGAGSPTAVLRFELRSAPRTRIPAGRRPPAMLPRVVVAGQAMELPRDDLMARRRERVGRRDRARRRRISAAGARDGDGRKGRWCLSPPPETSSDLLLPTSSTTPFAAASPTRTCR
jgi:hypothetical protein